MAAMESHAILLLLFYRILSASVPCGLWYLCLTDSLNMQELHDRSLNGSTNQAHIDRGTDTMFIRGAYLLDNSKPPMGKDMSYAFSSKISDNEDDTNRPLSFVWMIPSASQVTCLVIITVMATMLRHQHTRITVLQKELLLVTSEGESDDAQFEQIRETFTDKQNRYSRTMDRVTTVSKRIEHAYIQLDKAKELHDTVYEDLRYWKQTWINQTAKIRQTTPEQLRIVTKLLNSDVENLQLQKKVIRNFISETESRFQDVFNKLKYDKEAIDLVFNDIECLQGSMGISPRRCL